MIAWHKADLMNRMYINIGNGKKAAMPRYYKQKIYTDDEREIIGHHQMQRGIEENNKFIVEQGEMYEHNREQAKIAAFQKAAHQSLQRNKI